MKKEKELKTTKSEECMKALSQTVQDFKVKFGLAKETDDALMEVYLKNVMIGDKVFVENDLGGVEYTILDLEDPFILIEDETTRFAYLHRVNKLYIKIKKLKND